MRINQININVDNYNNNVCSIIYHGEHECVFTDKSLKNYFFFEYIRGQLHLSLNFTIPNKFLFQYNIKVMESERNDLRKSSPKISS